MRQDVYRLAVDGDNGFSPVPADRRVWARIKAEILVEALPYIRRFWQKIVVVKYGGNALGGGSTLGDFATDIVLMRSVGMRPVVVHGGRTADR